MYTRECTRAGTRTYTWTRVDAHVCTRAYTHGHVSTRTRIYTDTRECTRARTCIYMDTHECTRALTRIYMCTRISAHAHAHAHRGRAGVLVGQGSGASVQHLRHLSGCFVRVSHWLPWTQGFSSVPSGGSSQLSDQRCWWPGFTVWRSSVPVSAAPEHTRGSKF